MPRGSILLLLGIVAVPWSGELPAQTVSPTQWKQSIERPNRGWDYDGNRILGHIGHDICLWDAATGERLHRMKEHKERIQKVQFSPNGERALSSSWLRPGPMVPYTPKETRTILWNLATGQSEHLFPGQVAGEFSPDGKRIVTFSRRSDKSASFDAAVWDVLTGRELVKVPLDGASGLYSDALHFSPDGTRFVHINTRGAVLFDAGNGRQIGRVAVVYGIQRYTSTGALAYFALGMDLGRISLFDIESGRTLRTLRGFEHDMKGAWDGAWTHDGRKVAAFPTHGAIRIWDIESGTMIAGAQGGNYPQNVIIISPDNSRLAIAWGGSYVENKEVEREFGLYDLNTGAQIAVIGLIKTGTVIGFSPDSKTLLASGSEFAIYNSGNGKKLRTLTLEAVAEP